MKLVSAIDFHLLDMRSRTIDGWRRGLLEFVYFGIKNARACLFVGLFLAAVMLIPRAGIAAVRRYDVLLALALLIQFWMLRSGLETRTSSVPGPASMSASGARGRCWSS
jgi:hypothetical protein